MMLIDSCARPRFVDGRLDTASLLEEMDRAGIQRAVIAAPDEFVCLRNDEGNQLILDAVHHHADRLSGMAAVNPWHGSQGAAALSGWLDKGLVGLYLNPVRQGFLLTESLLDPLLEVCAAHGTPVYSTIGTPVVAMPFQLAEVARRHPRVTFVLGNASWTDFCGYDVIPACRQAANILVDPSCAIGPSVAGFVEALGPARILFCTAYPRSRHEMEVAKIRGLGLDPAALQAVFHDNAAALWRLPT
jgi:predicted TIM-barrel fold metal-dependent hydrolase